MLRNDWPSFGEALHRLHAPESEADLAPSALPRMRLAYDELLANQLALAVIRQRMKKRAGRRLAATGKLRKAIVAEPSLQAHRRADPRARRDRRRPRKPAPHAPPAARRCRQRQDGGGAARSCRRGRGRHARRADGADRASRAPASEDDQRARRRPRACASRCSRDASAGASARPFLLRWRRARSTSSSARTRCSRSPSQFRDLGLVVIDEQHRFGVHQRLALQGKGQRQRRRTARHDGDAHPAHAAAHELWRHGRLAARREAAGAQAGRDRATCRSSGWRR